MPGSKPKAYGNKRLRVLPKLHVRVRTIRAGKISRRGVHGENELEAYLKVGRLNVPEHPYY